MKESLGGLRRDFSGQPWRESEREKRGRPEQKGITRKDWVVVE